MPRREGSAHGPGRLRRGRPALVFPLVVHAGRRAAEAGRKGGADPKPDVLRAQVERLLNDPKARRFTANFAGQWLDLRNINATSPDPQIYGEFDDFLFWSMPRETERFFEEILRADRSLTEFVHSDWTFLNQRLAQHYGIAGVSGGELRKVKLPPDSHRGGVLTQASILKVTADGTRTSPVLRGKWVLDRILGQPPSPPPPDIPAIEPDIRGATTIRQQLDKHRNTPACAVVPPAHRSARLRAGDLRRHRRLARLLPRPPGRRGMVELANYPGRKIFRGLDVEKGGKTPDGQPFKDIDDYKQLLLADKDQLARNLARKLIDLRHRSGHPVRRPRGGRGAGGQVPRPELRLPLAGARGGAEPGVSEQVRLGSLATSRSFLWRSMNRCRVPR